MMSDKDTTIVADLSNTQRVSLKRGNSSVTIQKDFRKGQEEEWTTSKGIEVPNKFIPELIKQLTESPDVAD